MFELTVAPFTVIMGFILGIQIGHGLFDDLSNKNHIKIQWVFTVTILMMALYSSWLRHL